MGGSYVTIPNYPSMQINSWSTNNWINGAGEIYSNRYPSGGHDSFGTELNYNGSAIALNIGDVNGGWFSVGNIYVNVGTLTGWNMITTTVTPTAWDMYVNGALKAQGTFGGGTPIFIEPFATHLALGAGFGGSVGDFGFYNTTLATSDVQTLYYGGVVSGFGALPATTQVRLATGAIVRP